MEQPILCSYPEGIDFFHGYNKNQEVMRVYDRPWVGCAFCENKELEATLHPGKLPNEYSRQLEVCRVCGWWSVYVHLLDTFSSDFTNDDIYGLTYRGSVKEYAVSALDVPLGELHRHLIAHPNHMAYVNPIAFERLMESCLRSIYPYASVAHVGGTGDGGVDLKMVTHDAGVWLVQVKRRGDISKAESVSVVRELNGVLFREGLAQGMIITTARSYSQAARRETNIKTETKDSYVVKLLKFDDIVSMLRVSRPEPYQPWTKFI